MPEFASNKSELAAAFGRSVDCIDSWRNKGAPAKTEHGWDIAAWRLWKLANVDRRGVSGLDDERRLLAAQADERESKAALAALKLAIEKGEYLLRAEVERREANIGRFVRDWLLGIARDWPPRLVGLCEREMRTAIDRLARDTLTRMARMSPGHEETQ